MTHVICDPLASRPRGAELRHPLLRRAARTAAVAALIGLTGCLNAFLAARKEREVAAVDAVIRDFNAALTRGDTLALRSLLRQDFRMIEDSVEYDVESAVTAVAGVLTAGSVARDLTDLRIEQRGSFAWATYRVKGQYVTGRDTLRFSRLEATVLQKIEKDWVIAFMTSAPAAP